MFLSVQKGRHSCESQLRSVFDGYNKYGVATTSTLDLEQSYTNKYIGRSDPPTPSSPASPNITTPTRANSTPRTTWTLSTARTPHSCATGSATAPAQLELNVVPTTVRLTQERLSTFSYRAAPLEQVEDMTSGSGIWSSRPVSCTSRTTAQLRSGSTIARAAFGPARFEDAGMEGI